MNGLTIFGAGSMALMVAAYAYEKRSHWFTLAFAAGCVLAATYAFLTESWLFGILETVWYLIAMRRWADGRLFR